MVFTIPKKYLQEFFYLELECYLQNKLAKPCADGNIVYQFGYKEKETLWSYQPASSILTPSQDSSL
jgi:hypothetical protein